MHCHLDSGWRPKIDGPAPKGCRGCDCSNGKSYNRDHRSVISLLFSLDIMSRMWILNLVSRGNALVWGVAQACTGKSAHWGILKGSVCRRLSNKQHAYNLQPGGGMVTPLGAGLSAAIRHPVPLGESWLLHVWRVSGNPQKRQAEKHPPGKPQCHVCAFHLCLIPGNRHAYAIQKIYACPSQWSTSFCAGESDHTLMNLGPASSH